MTLNGVMVLILRYFTEFGSFRTQCVKVVEEVTRCKKKFTFAISSPDEFLVLNASVVQNYTITADA